MHDAQSPTTPVSPAVRAAQKKLRGAKGGKKAKAKAKTKAPCGGQVVGEATVVGQGEHEAGQEGGKECTEGQQGQKEQQEQQEGEDSFVKAIQTRSPVKTAPSSLETRRETSTEKITVEIVVVGKKDEVKEDEKGKAEGAPFVQRKSVARSSVPAVKRPSTKGTTATFNTAVGRAASNPTKPSTAAAKATAKPRASSSLAAAAAKRRSSIFVPTKSTKPPTRSTFALPGEAVAAKLKEQRLQREERMRLQGERDAKCVKIQKENPKKQMDREKGKGGVRVSNVAGKVLAVKGSVVLSSTARPSAVKKITNTTTTTTTTTKTKEEKANARESLMAKPAKRESAAGEQAKKDGNVLKDLAQARAEAAVRGRQASREWAEKERAREQEMAKTKAA